MKKKPPLFAIAPMMEWTDRHCRFFHRLFSPHTQLYSEMITAKAILYGDRNILLTHSPSEHPLALQVGGSNPYELAQATEIATQFGYNEVNLNCGCPSARVQSGEFGAALMRKPHIVQNILKEMRTATHLRISVKCRIGVDNDSEAILPTFLNHVMEANVRHVTIHARKAWLKGLSPKENRTIPPLHYDRIYEMKTLFPELHISINGNITTADAAKAHIDKGLDGVMVGRAAYHNPRGLLGNVEKTIFANDSHSPPRAEDIIATMANYINSHCDMGGRAHHVTRHMLNLFNNQPGARAWRRILTHHHHNKMRGDILYEAFEKVRKSDNASKSV